jgi:hypothetical protein
MCQNALISGQQTEELQTKKGLAMSNGISAISLAAMQTDCNLKRWQLLRVAKHVGAATNSRLSVKPKELKKFDDQLVLPRTGKWTYRYKSDKGETTVEHIKYEYQPVVEVFKYVVAQLLMEEGTSDLEVKDVFMAIGGDRGIGALRVTLCVIIIIQSGKIVKRDIRVATVYCKKENSTTQLNRG